MTPRNRATDGWSREPPTPSRWRSAATSARRGLERRHLGPAASAQRPARPSSSFRFQAVGSRDADAVVRVAQRFRQAREWLTATRAPSPARPWRPCRGPPDRRREGRRSARVWRPWRPARSAARSVRRICRILEFSSAQQRRKARHGRLAHQIQGNGGRDADVSVRVADDFRKPRNRNLPGPSGRISRKAVAATSPTPGSLSQSALRSGPGSPPWHLLRSPRKVCAASSRTWESLSRRKVATLGTAADPIRSNVERGRDADISMWNAQQFRGERGDRGPGLRAATNRQAAGAASTAAGSLSQSAWVRGGTAATARTLASSSRKPCPLPTDAARAPTLGTSRERLLCSPMVESRHSLPHLLFHHDRSESGSRKKGKNRERSAERVNSCLSHARNKRPQLTLFLLSEAGTARALHDYLQKLRPF